MIKPLDERECCTYNFQQTIIRERNYIYICIETDIIYKYIYIYIYNLKIILKACAIIQLVLVTYN